VHTHALLKKNVLNNEFVDVRGLNHRIIESFRLEKTSKIMHSNRQHYWGKTTTERVNYHVPITAKRWKNFRWPSISTQQN